MDDRADERGRQVQVLEVQPGTAHFEQVLILAARVLAQDRYLASRIPHALESHVLAAFDRTRCTGFLRYLVQVIGAEEGGPAVMHNGEPLLEGFVEAFGVDPQRRRRGIGTALQQHAARRCRTASCYQMRSRSPVTSAENYALKIAAGYVLHPSRPELAHLGAQRTPGCAAGGSCRGSQAGAARFPGVLLSRGPLRACCYRRGSAAAARSRATDPAATRAHPAAILGLRRCTARATQGTWITAFGASTAIASTVSRRGQRRPHHTPRTIPTTVEASLYWGCPWP